MNLYGFAAGDPVNFSDPFGLEKECVRCVLWWLTKMNPALGAGGAALTGLTVGRMVASQVARSGLQTPGQKVFEAGRRVGNMELGQNAATRAVEHAVLKMGLETAGTESIAGVNYVLSKNALPDGTVPAVAVDFFGKTSKAYLTYSRKGWEVVKDVGAIAAPK